MMVFAINAAGFVVSSFFWSRAGIWNQMVGLTMALLAMANGSLAIFAYLGEVPK